MTDYTVYIHLPFCKTRCNYCDFFSTTTDPIPFSDYGDAVLREWRARINGMRIDSIISVYIGGGTPSLWPAENLSRLLEGIGLPFDGTEITVEVNPQDAGTAWFERLKRLGVTRFSIGVQALSDERLRWLHRRHDKNGAVQAVKMACESGIPSVSADIIYGTPGQTPDGFREELRELATLGVDHISAYELTVGPGTALAREVEAGNTSLPDEETMVSLWHTARETLHKYGFEQYEVSNYAKPGRESIHNCHYWQGGFYFGLGLGAHGFLKTHEGELMRYANRGGLPDYLEETQGIAAPCVKGLGHGAFSETLSLIDHVRERVMLGLRTPQGLPFDVLLKQLSKETAMLWEQTAKALAARGLVKIERGRLMPTTIGLLHADTVAEEFF